MEVVNLLDSGKEGRTQEERLKNKWLTRYKNAKSSTAFIGSLVGHEDKEDFALEDLFPEDYYLKKFQESHKKKMQIAGVNNISLTGKGILCQGVSRACEKVNLVYNKRYVVKLIQKDIVKMKNVNELVNGTEDKAKNLLENLSKLFN